MKRGDLHAISLENAEELFNILDVSEKGDVSGKRDHTGAIRIPINVQSILLNSFSSLSLLDP